MQYRNLGRAGLRVSEICLGTMTFGNGADQNDSEFVATVACDNVGRSYVVEQQLRDFV